MRCCKFCKWANVAMRPRTVILSPDVTLRQERGSIICTKPIVSRVIQANGKWSCSDYEQRERKARRK